MGFWEPQNHFVFILFLAHEKLKELVICDGVLCDSYSYIPPMRIIPLTYCSFLSEEEVATHECSDRIWVPQRMFERWMMEEDVGSLVIVRLEQIAACIYGPHSEGAMRIYAPTWMCEAIGVSLDPPEDEEDDFVEAERIHPQMCTFLQLQPHTSDHLYDNDPEETLSRAFEEYTCIMPGQTLSLRLPNGIRMEATVVSSEPAEGPLCIRNAEIVLDLLQPLDFVPEPEPLIEPVHTIQPIDTPVQSMPSREERRALYAAAAMNRLRTPQ